MKYLAFILFLIPFNLFGQSISSTQNYIGNQIGKSTGCEYVGIEEGDDGSKWDTYSCDEYTDKDIIKMQIDVMLMQNNSLEMYISWRRENGGIFCVLDYKGDQFLVFYVNNYIYLSHIAD